jgi:hypothetical protein
VHHPSEDLWCICWRLRECSTRTTAAAVQRVEALFLGNLHSNGFVNAIIAAIKGDSDD